MKPPYSGEDILYSGHLSTTDTFLRDGLNDGQTLITKPLCSGRFIAEFILRSWLTFPTRSDLLIADKSKNESQKCNSCKKFLYVLFHTVLYIFFKFKFLFYFFFWASLWPFQVKAIRKELAGISSPYPPPRLMCFPVTEMSKAQWGRDRNMNTILDIFFGTCPNTTSSL